MLAWATGDDRVVAGAVVGSMAVGPGDEWSDLDLTFAVGAGATVAELLADWTDRLQAEFNAAHLFDLPVGATVYRVFLVPGCLQFDLSFSPAAEFGARGPKFRLLFGEAVNHPVGGPPSAQYLFGLGAHHALRARFCTERGRLWQAEFWASGVRDCALGLACRRLGLSTSHGRGFDDLPAAILESLQSALVLSLDRQEMLRALGCAIAGLLREADEVRKLADQVAPELLKLSRPWAV